jgi:transposase
MTALVDRLVSDELWAIVEPSCRRHPGRPTAADTAPSATAASLPRSCSWRAPPPVAVAARQGAGCGSPATAWRRLAEWVTAGMFDQLHLVVLDRLGEQGRLDWSRASVDSASVRAKRGGPRGANPVDRGKPGSKIHLVCEGHGLPLTAAVTAANVPDVTMLEAMVDDVPPVRTSLGRRRCRPGKLDADKGYDSAGNRTWLRRRGIAGRIARRGIESSDRLGRHRWRVERARSWLSWWRRLEVRWDRVRSGGSRSCCWLALTCVRRL